MGDALPTNGDLIAATERVETLGYYYRALAQHLEPEIRLARKWGVEKVALNLEAAIAAAKEEHEHALTNLQQMRELLSLD